MKRIIFKTLKVLGWILLSVIVLLICIIVAIQIPYIQNKIKDVALSYVREKIDTPVSLDRIEIAFPKKIVVKGLYVESQERDTLLYTQYLGVNISLLKLLNNTVSVDEIELDGLKATVKRDSLQRFNFDFITEAFASEEEQEKESSPMIIQVGQISLKNIDLNLADEYQGNFVQLKLNRFITRFKDFDLGQMKFSIPKINLEGVDLDYLKKPSFVIEDVEKKQDGVEEEQVKPQISLGNIEFKSINLYYRDEVEKLNVALNLGSFTTDFDRIDLQNQEIEIDEIKLDKFQTIVRLLENQEVKNQEEAETVEIEPVINEPKKTWKLAVKNLDLAKIDLQYDNDNEIPVIKGIDPNHIALSNLEFKLKDFQFSESGITGNLKKLSFAEKSGLEIKEFKTYFLYGQQTSFVKDFYLETANTKLKSSIVLNYADAGEITKNLKDLSLDVSVSDSYIGPKDVDILLPDQLGQAGLKSMESEQLNLEIQAKGLLSDLNIDKFFVKGLQSTFVNVSGKIKGLPEVEKAYYNMQVKDFQTTAKDILAIVPANTVPNTLEIPALLSLQGYFKGTTKAFETDLNLKTSLGNTKLNADLDLRNKGHEKYKLDAEIKNLNVGRLIKNDSIGKISLSAHVSGNSFEPEKATASANLAIEQAEFNGYFYHDLNIDGVIEKGVYQVKTQNKDSNLEFDIQANGIWTTQNLSLKMLADLSNIDLYNLHLTDQHLRMAGKIEADMNNILPDSLAGKTFVNDFFIDFGDKQYTLKPIVFEAEASQNFRKMTIDSQVVSFEMEGDYQLTKLGESLTHTIKNYFDFGAEQSEKDITKEEEQTEGINRDQFFSYQLNINDEEILHEVLPDLKEIQPVNLSGSYKLSTNWISLEGKVPLLKYGENEINNIKLSLKPNQNALYYDVGIDKIANASIALDRANLNGDIKGNTIAYDLNLKDKQEALWYVVAGKIRAVNNSFEISLNQNGFMLDYNLWNINPENAIVMTEGGFYAKNFDLTYKNSFLKINSEQELANSPLKIEFQNFDIELLTQIVQKDKVLAGGFIDGDIFLKDLTTDFRFVSDLDISKLHVMEIPLGNLHVGVKNKTQSQFLADVILEGGENKMELKGFVDADEQKMYLKLDLEKLQMKALESFTKGNISDAQGYFSGTINIGGKFTEPKILGSFDFNDIGVHVNPVNADFKNINEKISFTERGIELDKFSITDSDGNLLVIDGQVLTKTYRDYAFNLSIKALDFKAINSTEKDNDMYYGTLIFDTNLNIKGDLNKPVVTGGIGIGEKTNFTIVLPQEDPSIADREGIVEFIDEESLREAERRKYEDDFNKSALQGLDVSLAINVDKEATFNMIMDKSSGDKITIKGDADLVGGIDPSGKVTLTGRYEFTDGSYDLSFNFIKRKFVVQPGSSIIWTGEPTSANLDLTAVYEIKTAPIDLLEGQLGDLSQVQQNMYKQKIPFQALLKMKGELLKPEISFDVLLKEGISNVSGDVISNTKTKLEQLRTNESELNKQVFALLLLNRFIGENPFESSAGGMSAGAMARQSVSRLLSDQLNNLASNLISGVELNFNLESSEDFSTGTRENRTDLNVAVSKRLFSDRLKVTVGSSFEVEGAQRENEQVANIAGDIELEYALSKDGRYVMRVYRKNQYEVALQGQIIETGVGFVITMSYEKFKELFERSKDRKQLKKQLKDESNQDK